MDKWNVNNDNGKDNDDIIIHYKRVNNYDNVNVIQSIINNLYVWSILLNWKNASNKRLKF